MLGREPASDNEVRNLTRLETVAELRKHLMSTPEFVSRVTNVIRPGLRQPIFEYSRPCVVFVHIHKAAGTSITQILEGCFPKERRCPERFNHLHKFAPGELCGYDCYSGHYDLFSTRFVPRANVFRFTFLRDPRARLMSFYRFARRQAPMPHIMERPIFSLAMELSVVDYFKDPRVRTSRFINNHYKTVLSGSLAPLRVDAEMNEAKVGPLRGDRKSAIENLQSLNGVGLVEKINDSVKLIFSAAGLPAPNEVPKLRTFEKERAPGDLSTVAAEMEASGELDDLLAELIADDNEIYAAAKARLDEMLAKAER